MTGRLLDVSVMPSEQVFTCSDGTFINMSKFLMSHRSSLREMANSGLIKKTESFGFAMPRPRKSWYDLSSDWDDPESFIWFVGGWGPQQDRYVANAIRKLRALLRYLDKYTANNVKSLSTLDLRFFMPNLFEDVVNSANEDGTFSWGDFPWGGAVLQQMGDLKLIGAVSALTEIEDDFITKLILGGLGQKIVKGNKLLADD